MCRLENCEIGPSPGVGNIPCILLYRKAIFTVSISCRINIGLLSIPGTNIDWTVSRVLRLERNKVAEIFIYGWYWYKCNTDNCPTLRWAWLSRVVLALCCSVGVVWGGGWWCDGYCDGERLPESCLPPTSSRSPRLSRDTTTTPATGSHTDNNSDISTTQATNSHTHGLTHAE